MAAEHIGVWVDGVIIKKHRKVTHTNPASLVDDLLIILDILEQLTKLAIHLLRVVVAPDEDLSPLELLGDSDPLRDGAPAEVTQDIHGVLRCHSCVPPADDLRLHLFNCGEWAVVETKDVFVAEVKV